MRDSVISAKSLTKKYGDFCAVNGIDLEVPHGVCFGLLGPNRAGKPTMIQTIQASSPISEGRLSVLGKDTVQDSREIRKKIGVIPQEDNLDPDFTVKYNLLVYARYYGLSNDEAKKRAADLLDKVKLTDKADEEIANLSGGMNRSLIVARGMINNPELLILDEPTTGLDPQARHSVWDQIRIFKNKGKTVLLTTHYMDEAEILCDELAIMDSGKILIQGKPKDLIQETIGESAAEFVSLSFGESGSALENIEKHCKLNEVKYSRITDRVIIYGNEIENIISKFEKEKDLTDVIRRRGTLEDVFLNLTGRQLRD